MLFYSPKTVTTPDGVQTRNEYFDHTNICGIDPHQIGRGCNITLANGRIIECDSDHTDVALHIQTQLALEAATPGTISTPQSLEL